jgi:hypothetical protein
VKTFPSPLQEQLDTVTELSCLLDQAKAQVKLAKLRVDQARRRLAASHSNETEDLLDQELHTLVDQNQTLANAQSKYDKARDAALTTWAAYQPFSSLPTDRK